MIDEKAFLRDYAKGQGCYVLARKYGVSSTTLSNLLIKHGVKARGRRVRVIPEDEAWKLVAKQGAIRATLSKYLKTKPYIAKWWFRDYLSVGDAARKYGVSELTFRRTLAGYGLEYPKIPARTLHMLKGRFGGALSVEV